MLTFFLCCCVCLFYRHYPKTQFTTVADTPENLRLKKQSMMQSQVTIFTLRLINMQIVSDSQLVMRPRPFIFAEN